MEPGPRKCPASMDLHPTSPPLERKHGLRWGGGGHRGRAGCEQGLYPTRAACLFPLRESWAPLCGVADCHLSRSPTLAGPPSPAESGEGKRVPTFPKCLLWAWHLPASPPMEGVPFAFPKRKLSPRDREGLPRLPQRGQDGAGRTQLIELPSLEASAPRMGLSSLCTLPGLEDPGNLERGVRLEGGGGYGWHGVMRAP